MRNRMLGLLRVHGPATATTLATRLGVNTGATSYHLRQLAEAGLVVEDDTRGNARDRWWKSAHQGTEFDKSQLLDEEPELALGFLHGIGQVYAENMFQAIDALQTQTPEWREATLISDYFFHLSAGREQQMLEEVLAVLEKYRTEDLTAPDPRGLQAGHRPDPGLPPGNPMSPLTEAPGSTEAPGKTTATPRTPYRVPLIAYLVANVVSLCGTRVSAIAIPWFVLVTTGSPMKTGLVAFAEMTPLVLCKAFGGPLIDRIGGRRISVSADLVSTFVVALIPLLHVLHLLSFPALLTLVAIAGALRGPGDAAKHTLVPDIAAAAKVPLERVTGLESTTERLSGFIAYGIAGGLITLVGTVNALWVDAISFAVCAALIRDLGTEADHRHQSPSKRTRQPISSSSEKAGGSSARTS